jgi:4-hydroxy-3-methylbut-2-enyl diphosphate reductase
VAQRLRELGARSVRTIDGVIENIVFPLPKGLGGNAGAARAGAEAAAPLGKAT